MKVVSSQWSVVRKNVFCFVLCAMLFALCFPAAALQSAGKVPRIGFLISDSASDPRNQVLLDALRQGLRDLGYVEGKTINIEYRYAEGRFERLPELVGELVRLKVDILFGTDNRAARAAKKSSTTIPIIITSGGDPVRSGLVASLARPGGNVTGLTTTSSHLIGKRLELLKEVVPKVSRFAFLMPADSAGLRAMYNEAQGTAKALGVTFQLLEVKAPTPDIEGAFRFMVKGRIGGLVTESPALIDLHQNKILELAEKHRIPGIYVEQEWAASGGLMSYGANRPEQYRRAAIYVDKILKGAKPADLPVEQPTRFELIINMKAAKQIGLVVPPSVLARAGKVIK